MARSTQKQALPARRAGGRHRRDCEALAEPESLGIDRFVLGGRGRTKSMDMVHLHHGLREGEPVYCRSCRSTPFPSMKRHATLCLSAVMTYAGTAHATASVEVAIRSDTVGTDVVQTGVTLASNTLSLGSGSGSGVADLSAGSLRVNSVAPAYDPQSSRDDSQVIAQFSDTLTFSSGASGVAYLNYHIDGLLSTAATVGNQVTNSAYATLGIFIAGDHSGRLADFGDVFTDTNCGSFAEPRCAVGTSFSDNGAVPFPIGAGGFTLQIALSAIAFNGGSANFSNTALFSLTLPQGVTYTSASGAFLATAAPVVSAVPEPSTCALVGAGLAFAAGAARRRQRVR